MNNLSRLLFLFVITFYFPTSLAAEITATATPTWTVPTKLSFDYDPPEDQLRDGIYYLLVDSQTMVENNNQVTRYRRNARHITNPSGVETSSQIDISYDPSYQKMRLHTLRVWREGRPVDKLASARVSVLQQEQELDKLIYNGNETINFVLNDVRVGDVLDYSYSVTGDNPVYSGIFSQSSYFQWTVPVFERSVRLLWLKEKPIEIKKHSNTFSIEQSKRLGGVEYAIVQKNIAPLQSENNTPDWFDKYPFIEFSESQNWKEIVDWSIPLFENALSSAPSIKEVAKKITEKSSIKSKQLLEALQYVQQEIRYLGIEIGENSHRPSDAEETLMRRYGDCKDKTVLLISILKELEIVAYPALVNTYLSDELVNRLPKPGAFDHVIVKVILEGKVYWLDPTRQYQNNALDKVFQPDYDRVLVVTKNTEELEKPNVSTDKNFQHTIDEFTLSKNYQNPITYKSVSKMSGLEAERNRSSFASKGLALLRDNYHDYYKGYYPGVKRKEELEFFELNNGDRESKETYTIENFWEKNQEKKRFNAWFYANTISGYLSRKYSKSRKEPLAISFPINLKQTILVKFEEGDWGFTDESLIEDNEFFEYSQEVVYAKNEKLLTLTYSYISKTPFIPEGKLSEYDAALEKLEDSATYGIYRNMELVGDSTEGQDEVFLDDYQKVVLLIVVVYLVLLIASIILWRIDSSKNRFEGEMVLYPVSILKYLALSMITYGIYSAYWLYKNFKYFKQRSNEKIMPIARGIFDYFWFYSLYSRLIDDSHQRYEKNHLPHEFIGISLAFIYFFLAFAKNMSDYVVLALLASAIVGLPMVIYVNRVNQENEKAIAHNSKWSIRHTLISIASVPLLLISMGSAIRILPADTVIPGDQLMSYDLKYLQRKGVIEPGDKIDYFSSDAVFFIRADGNGFTNNYVFSYWVNENDEFEFRRANYSKVNDLKITWATNELTDTVVKVILEDESYFLLFVSAIEKKDKIFVKELKKYWNANK